MLPSALPRQLSPAEWEGAFAGRLLDLGSPQIIVDPLLGQQFTVVADFGDFAFVQHVRASRSIWHAPPISLKKLSFEIFGGKVLFHTSFNE